MDTSLHDLIVHTFATVEGKALDTLMQNFAADAILIDPHFPVKRMQWKAVITEGFREAMDGMRSFGYTIVNYFESTDGQRAAVETVTHHILKAGKRLNFRRYSSSRSRRDTSRGCKHTNHTDHIGSWGSFCFWHASPKDPRASDVSD